MNEAVKTAIFLKDYTPPDFLIEETHLNFQLAETATTVNARLLLRRNPAGQPDAPLVLELVTQTAAAVTPGA